MVNYEKLTDKGHEGTIQSVEYTVSLDLEVITWVWSFSQKHQIVHLIFVYVIEYFLLINRDRQFKKIFSCRIMICFGAKKSEISHVLG